MIPLVFERCNPSPKEPASGAMPLGLSEIESQKGDDGECTFFHAPEMFVTNVWSDEEVFCLIEHWGEEDVRTDDVNVLRHKTLPDMFRFLCFEISGRL